MLSFLSLWSNCWLPSEFSHLPAVEGAEPARADYLLIAKTLDQLLAQCTPRGARREFGAALRAHRAMKAPLRAGLVPRLPAQLLNDLSHEIALYADRPSRDAALRCLRRSVEARRQPLARFA